MYLTHLIFLFILNMDKCFSWLSSVPYISVKCLTTAAPEGEELNSTAWCIWEGLTGFPNLSPELHLPGLTNWLVDRELCACYIWPGLPEPVSVNTADVLRHELAPYE